MRPLAKSTKKMAESKAGAYYIWPTTSSSRYIYLHNGINATPHQRVLRKRVAALKKGEKITHMMTEVLTNLRKEAK